MLGVFAEFERAIIRERIKSGLARAKADGRRLGRPRVGKAAEDRVRNLLREGYSIHKSARLAGVGTSVVQRIRTRLRKREKS